MGIPPMTWKTASISISASLSTKVRDWDQTPAARDIHNFYGGDLQGVMDKLDYLQDLELR